MKVRHMALAILVALVAQTTLAWLSGTARLNVDLPLVAVVFTALAAGPMAGFLAGAVAGGAQDLLSGGIVGVSGLSKSLVGLAVGGIGAQILASGVLVRLVMVAAATVVHAWGFIAIYALMPQIGPPGAWGVILAQAAANTAAALVAVALLRHGPGWSKAWRQRGRPAFRPRRIG